MQVEGVLKLCPYVENAMVHASSKEKFCTALICPSWAAIRKFAEANGIATDDLETVAKEQRVVAEVLKGVKDVSKGKLSGFEIPEKITLVAPSRTWTPENDMLTAAMKLKRKPICNAHSEDIEKMYK